MRTVLVGFLLVTIGAVTAAGQIWSPVGPELFPVLCGTISSTNPQVAAVAVSKGTTAVLYFTTDRGSNWSTTADLLTFRPFAIVFEHGSDTILYAAAGDVFRSTDQGRTWTQLTTPDGSVWLNLGFNPSDSSEVWLAGYSDASRRGRASVAVSTDAGATWTMRVCDTTPRSSAHSIALDPTRDSTLYCGGSIAGRAVVYKSTDKGVTWAAYDLPSPASADSGSICGPPAQDVPVLGQVRFLYVDPLNTSVLLAAQPWYGVCRSTNAGVTWYHYPGILEAHSLAFSPPQPQLVYVGATKGIYRTTDAGRTWSGPQHPPYSGIVYCILTCTDSALGALATNGSGVLRTINQWGDWGSLAVLDTVFVSALAVGSTGPCDGYAAVVGFGVFRTTEDRSDWSPCGGFPGSDSVAGLAVSNDNVWALTAGGLYHSTDRGEAWIPKDDWLDHAGAVTVSPLLSDLVAVTGRRSDSLASAVTTDRGVTWTRFLLCSGGTGRAVAFSPSEAGRVLVGGDSAGASFVVMTRDTGRTWQRVGTGLSGTVHCLRFRPSGGNELYCGTSAGAFQSTDTGLSWQYRGLAHANALVYAYVGGWRVLAGTDSGVYLREGGSWIEWSSGLLSSAVTAMDVDQPNYRLLAGTRTAGLFRGWAPPGVSEEPGQTPPSQGSAPTVVRGVLFLSSLLAPDCLLFSADGRRVMTLRPGANDVRALTPGVYFVQQAPAQAQAVHKVVVTR
jgi:photosystem II stability/assembly factor-like uncharacterized protein